MEGNIKRKKSDCFAFAHSSTAAQLQHPQHNKVITTKYIVSVF